MAKKKIRTPAEKKEKAIRQTELMDLAAIVSERVQIKSLILVESVAKRTPEAKIGGKDSKLELTVKVGQAEASEKTIVVVPRFALAVRGADQEAPMLSIEANFVIMYSLGKIDDIRPENIKAFAQINGVYNVWPYWREFVQSTVARMGLAPLTIPVYCIPTSGESKSNHRSSKS
jgi:preprotein translocase subunit SecB